MSVSRLYRKVPPVCAGHSMLPTRSTPISRRCEEARSNRQHGDREHQPSVHALLSGYRSRASIGAWITIVDGRPDLVKLSGVTRHVEVVKARAKGSPVDA